MFTNRVALKMHGSKTKVHTIYPERIINLDLENNSYVMARVESRIQLLGTNKTNP